MNSDSSMDEFLEDFGTPPLSDKELDGVLDRASQSSDGPEDQVVKIARFLLRTEGAIGKGSA